MPTQRGHFLLMQYVSTYLHATETLGTKIIYAFFLNVSPKPVEQVHDDCSVLSARVVVVGPQCCTTCNHWATTHAD